MYTIGDLAGSVSNCFCSVLSIVGSHTPLEAQMTGLGVLEAPDDDHNLADLAESKLSGFTGARKHDGQVRHFAVAGFGTARTRDCRSDRGAACLVSSFLG